MIVNLAQQTREVMAAANFSPKEVQYVVYYMQNGLDAFRCSFSDFMEVAEDINFEMLDPLLQSRKMVYTSIEIVGTTWWMHRSDDLDTEDTWMIYALPIAKDKCKETFQEIEVYDIINEEDVIDSDYMDFIDDLDE